MFSQIQGFFVVTVIWQAYGSKIISDDPKKRAKNIPYVVKQIMKKYPVAPVKE